MRKGQDGEKNNGGKKEKEKTDGNSGHYIIASSRPLECRPLECRPLERHMLVPIESIHFR